MTFHVDRSNDDSWVEVSSRPSSASISSLDDEIITTGLHVSSPLPRRRRRQQPPQQNSARQQLQRPGNVLESDDENRLASSAEHVIPDIPRQTYPQYESEDVEPFEDEDDGDDEGTMPNIPASRSNANPGFQPHPNAFTNPHLSRRSNSTSVPSSVPMYSPPHPHAGLARRSFSHRNSRYQPDNDAALRASLTTLLSCAAAARGLPKRDDAGSGPSNMVHADSSGRACVTLSNQPLGLQLVRESDLLSSDAAVPDPVSPVAPPPSRRASQKLTPSLVSRAREKSKRSSSPETRSSSASSRSTKKKRTTQDAAASTLQSPQHTNQNSSSTTMLLSPTIMTWVVSAGVVVLVSVVGFGAGYVIGREVGRHEAASASAVVAAGNLSDASVVCGHEVMRSTTGGGLRRLRWGSPVGMVVR